jgi:uncharacterized YccA/Bax inhibitor family protein
MTADCWASASVCSWSSSLRLIWCSIFDFIESATESGNAPKYMEWVGAFGLMVTLVWLYIEILRLLAKLRNSE